MNKQQKRLEQKNIELEQKVSISTVALANSLGFKEDYVKPKSRTPNIGVEIVLPTQSAVQAWLRNRFNIHVYCMPTKIEGKSKTVVYSCIIFYPDKVKISNVDISGNYTEVLEKGLYKALRLLRINFV